VLGSSQAAHLPVEQPGRAYLRAGTGEPTALQIARVAVGSGTDAATSPQIRRWTWPAPQPPSSEPVPEGSSDLARLTRALTERAAASGTPAPHRPWRPPLPDELAPTDPPATHDGAGRTRLPLGLIDVPDRQTQEELELDLADGGAWLAVGGPRSGRTTLLRTVLGEAVASLGPAELHVHVVDPSGGALAAEAAGLPHTGTAISGADALRTVRLVDRLAREVAERRAGTTSPAAPMILLLVDGVEAVSTLLDEADPANGSAGLLRLVRDGAAAGVTCVLTADRAVPGGRLAGAVRQRLILPLPDRADYAVAGIPARAVPAHRPPGRALLGEDALECQLARPRRLPTRTGPAGRRPDGTAALRIAELPAEPVLPLPIHAGDTDPFLLPVGPGGDEGDPVVVDLRRTGGLLITGPPGSGRTAALEAFAEHLTAAGASLLRLGRPPTTGRPADQPAHDVAWLDPDDQSGAARWLAERTARPCAVIADDVGAPAESAALSALPALGGRTGVTLLAAGTAGQFAGHYQGPVAQLRRARAGLLLCPGPGDADLLGIRLPRTPLPLRPGYGWLSSGAGVDRVQVARRRIAQADPASRRRRTQSSSSTEPISCVAYQASS
jgi:S-DNA-T family DNA segregation ATPase FtsK/SpoIIIE